MKHSNAREAEVAFEAPGGGAGKTRKTGAMFRQCRPWRQKALKQHHLNYTEFVPSMGFSKITGRGDKHEVRGKMLSCRNGTGREKTDRSCVCKNTGRSKKDDPQSIRCTYTCLIRTAKKAPSLNLSRPFDK
jgi:hypothetical protein